VLEEVTPQMLSGMQAAGVDQAFAHSAGSTGGGPAGTMVFSHTPLTGVTRLHTLFNAYRMTVGRPGGGSFTLFAVHPQPPIDDASGWVADQAAIRNAVTGLGDQPAVIAGDFNATLDHQPMRELVGRGFEDSVVEAKSGWQPTWPSPGEVTLFSFPVPTMLQIDHVLVNSGVQALSTQTVTIDGSDHKAVVARLML
jgi:endonuclease/exonuclease/phosphatase (EEP) superfamily protein YafD